MSKVSVSLFLTDLFFMISIFKNILNLPENSFDHFKRKKSWLKVRNEMMCERNFSFFRFSERRGKRNQEFEFSIFFSLKVPQLWSESFVLKICYDCPPRP